MQAPIDLLHQYGRLTDSIVDTFNHYCQTRCRSHNAQILSLTVIRSVFHTLTETLMFDLGRSDRDQANFIFYHPSEINLEAFNELALNAYEKRLVSRRAVVHAKQKFVRTLAIDATTPQRSIVIPTKIPGVILVERLNGTLEGRVFAY